MITSWEGLFDLKKPQDLLRKLQHDYRRVVQAPTDTYAAFDFFVTAEHMLDWCYPGDDHEPDRRTLRQNSPLLQVCSHIANGAKHFRIERSHHVSVKHTKVEQPSFVPGTFQANAFQSNGQFLIDLREEEAEALGLGSPVEVSKLAEKVQHFWEEWLRKHPLS